MSAAPTPISSVWGPRACCWCWRPTHCRNQWHVEERGLTGSGTKPDRRYAAGAMNQTVRPPLQPIRIGLRLSARLPVDLRARGRGARRPHASAACAARRTTLYTAGVICAKVARYAERIHHPDRLTQPLRPQGAEGLGTVRADLVGRRARSRRREISRRRGKARQRGGLALLLRRHHGPGDARRHQPAAPRQEIFGLPLHHLRQPGLDRLHRRHRQARRSRSARDGEVRPAS